MRRSQLSEERKSFSHQGNFQKLSLVKLGRFFREFNLGSAELFCGELPDRLVDSPWRQGFLKRI